MSRNRTPAPEQEREQEQPQDAPAVDAPEQPQPDQDAPEQDAPEQPQDAAVSLAEQAATEEVVKAQRVFQTITVPGTDALASVPDPADPARTFALQREQRADGSEGPIMLAVVVSRTVKGAARPQQSVGRYPLAEMEAARSAMLAQGIRLFRAE